MFCNYANGPDNIEYLAFELDIVALIALYEQDWLQLKVCPK